MVSTYCEILACVALERKPYDSIHINKMHFVSARIQPITIFRLLIQPIMELLLVHPLKVIPIASKATTFPFNAQELTLRKSIAYAASITPDPYAGSTKRITLTVALTVNATTNHHAGSRMTFIFTQGFYGWSSGNMECAI